MPGVFCILGLPGLMLVRGQVFRRDLWLPDVQVLPSSHENPSDFVGYLLVGSSALSGFVPSPLLSVTTLVR